MGSTVNACTRPPKRWPEVTLLELISCTAAGAEKAAAASGATARLTAAPATAVVTDAMTSSAWVVSARRIRKVCFHRGRVKEQSDPMFPLPPPIVGKTIPNWRRARSVYRSHFNVSTQNIRPATDRHAGTELLPAAVYAAGSHSACGISTGIDVLVRSSDMARASVMTTVPAPANHAR